MEFSVLNQSPILKGHTVKESLQNTIQLAVLAENLGYKRFFVSEHHNLDTLIGTAPEVLVSHLAAHTHKIHIGAGGVMLSHHNPFHVAEQFQLINHLAEGRVDLGIGKAPGGTPLATRALQHELRGDVAPFNDRFVALKKYLNNTHEEAAELKVSPDISNPPQLFLLGGSMDSALFAAEQNVNYMFAHFINNDVTLLNDVALRYKESARRGKFIVALSVLVIEDERMREATLKENEYYQLKFKDGRKLRVINEAQAENFVRNSDEEIEVSRKKPSIIMGSADEVLEKLAELNRNNDIDEFMFHLPTTDAEVREHTLEALAPVKTVHHTKKAGIV
ncbi:MsnO8 family LLM class oxidoreductase [Lacicoccus alkaliphilus]|uniref:Luciferase family oxidoreductase, group 1 n=1 Tax=Lacicoccus alkaliphilus DSM 16010 TaxID=1123231 RepID=A0A1M7DS63_9BACL|nr:MsnO8 family LLM class oxidoreductase [Salinicoccus alkaliphilus]SHL82320.1 luciferase family oxidoreductase, group 1 [Salinicoccus alkaliphilus DSM 16010]